MALFQFIWLRRLIRRHTRPIPEDRAGTWKKRLSLAYMLIAWNAFGAVCYAIYQGKADWSKFHGLPQDQGTPAQQWAKSLGIKDATVYRVSGTNIKRYEIHEGTEQTPAEDSESVL